MFMFEDIISVLKVCSSVKKKISDKVCFLSVRVIDGRQQSPLFCEVEQERLS